jgi:hypothetical protein
MGFCQQENERCGFTRGEYYFLKKDPAARNKDSADGRAI